MMKETLKIIDSAMLEMGLNYEFAEWTSDIIYPYFVGEYQETEAISEDGLQEASFILTGFSRTTWFALEESKTKIESYFDSISGKRVMINNGSCAAIFYANSFVLPTGDAELKKIQINLNIKEWKVK